MNAPWTRNGFGHERSGLRLVSRSRNGFSHERSWPWLDSLSRWKRIANAQRLVTLSRRRERAGVRVKCKLTQSLSDASSTAATPHVRNALRSRRARVVMCPGCVLDHPHPNPLLYALWVRQREREWRTACPALPLTGAGMENSVLSLSCAAGNCPQRLPRSRSGEGSDSVSTYFIFAASVLPRSAGDFTVVTPAFSSAANLAAAVPLPPEMIAPA